VDRIVFQPVTELAGALARREISSRELLEAYLENIEAVNPAVNAVVTLDADAALAAAGTADAARASGVEVGPLHGVPMTIKDSIETAGIRTTSGSPDLAEHVPSRDADAVARLRAAGAIIFGKTNLPTLAMDWQSYNPLFGVTNNPWDETRAAGGSSGGSAAAIAAGLTGLELGSDIRGSLRVPAHFCGVFALKPTFGIVPGRGHIPGPPGVLSGADMGVLGPLGRSAEDLDLALGVLAGADPVQAKAWRLDLPPPRAESLGEYRIAAWLDDGYCAVDGATRSLLHEAVEALRGAGGSIDESARPVGIAEAHEVYERLFAAAISAGMPDFVLEAIEASTPPGATEDDPLALKIDRAYSQRHRDWILLHEHRLQLSARWAAFFQDYDALLCPVTPTPAIPHDHSADLESRTILVDGERRSYLEQSVWSSLAGAAYLPSVVVPVGLSKEGLPVGIQVIAPHLEDRTAIDIAKQIGQVTGGYQVPPLAQRG
jgi:amidase